MHQDRRKKNPIILVRFTMDISPVRQIDVYAIGHYRYGRKAIRVRMEHITSAFTAHSTERMQQASFTCLNFSFEVIKSNKIKPLFLSKEWHYVVYLWLVRESRVLTIVQITTDSPALLCRRPLIFMNLLSSFTKRGSRLTLKTFCIPYAPLCT